MEKTTIINDAFTETFEKLKALPYPLAKFYASKGRVQTSGYKEYIYENDERITSAFSALKMHFTTKGMYCKIDRTEGITYNKVTKKLTVWGKGKMGEKISFFERMLEYMGIDWFQKMKTYENYKHLPFGRMLTKTLAEQILKGKVTNPEEFIRTYTRISLHRSNIPWKLVRDFYNKFSIKYYSNHVTLKNILEYTTNPISALTKLVYQGLNDDYHTILNDALQQCFILDKKINLSWSYKRLCEEHEKMTDEITELDISTKDTTPIQVKGNLPLLEGMTLLLSEIDAFREATYMHNCIYTNYWRYMKDLNYFVVRYKKNGLHYDIGIYPLHSQGIMFIYRRGNREHSVIDQIKAVRNTNPPQEIIDEINQWFNTKEVLEFFDSQNKELPIQNRELVTANNNNLLADIGMPLPF